MKNKPIYKEIAQYIRLQPLKDFKGKRSSLKIAQTIILKYEAEKSKHILLKKPL